MNRRRVALSGAVAVLAASATGVVLAAGSDDPSSLSNQSAVSATGDLGVLNKRPAVAPSDDVLKALSGGAKEYGVQPEQARKVQTAQGTWWVVPGTRGVCIVFDLKDGGRDVPADRIRIVQVNG